MRILLLLGLSLLTACAPSGANLVGKQAPYTRFTMLDGDLVSSDQFSKQTTVFIFWATSCTTSPKTVEQVNRLANDLKSKGVKFVAVSLDSVQGEEAVRSVIANREMGNFVHAYSGNEAYDEAYLAFQGSRIPYIVIVNAQNQIVATGHSSSVIEDYFQG